MVLELAAPAGAGPALQRCIPHIQRVFRVRVSCSTAESSCESPNAGSSIIVNIEDGKEEDCTKAKVSMCVRERVCRRRAVQARPTFDIQALYFITFSGLFLLSRAK